MPPLRRARPKRMRPARLAAVLAVITIALVGISQLALPRGLEPTAELPPGFTDFTHHTSGYLHVGHDGPNHLALACDMRARLVADGRVVAETGHAGGEAIVAAPLAPWTHRVYIQHARSPRGKPPELRWRTPPGPWTPVPSVALAPRRLVPLA